MATFYYLLTGGIFGDLARLKGTELKVAFLESAHPKDQFPMGLAPCTASSEFIVVKMAKKVPENF